MIGGCIYKITNKINGKMYVGQTTQTLHVRFNSHCAKHSHCKYLLSAINTYGRSNFTIETLFSARSENKSELKDILNKEESKLIILLNTVAPNGYNLTSGGDCAKFNKESIESRAQKHKKPIRCNETGQIWESTKECAAYFGVKSQSIYRILRGIRDTFRGLSFSYINPSRSKNKIVRTRKIRSLDSYDLTGLYEKINEQKKDL